MKLIITLNLILSMTLIMLSHPLSMGMILLLQTILIAMITGNLNISFWYSYILFLVMVGGMLILFMYMTSIASNEKFKLNLLTFLPMMIIFPVIISKPWIIELMNKTIDTESLIKVTKINLSMMKFMQWNTMAILVFLISYLFITMIATVKISTINQGPLRQKN